MNTDIFDLIVIGAGPAGQAAAELAAFFGHRAAIVEHDAPGGVVTTTGGVPTKTLREAAIALTGVRLQEVYGVSGAVPLETALPIIRQRTAGVCDRLQRRVADSICARGIAYLKGTAALTADRSVLVTLADGSAREISARAIVVATGSQPARPAGIPLDDPDVYDSDRIVAMRGKPSSVLIVGGGPVGVEFATVFTALGVPATLVSQADRLLPTMDQELVALMSDQFEQRGVRLILNAGLTTMARVDGRLVATTSNGLSIDAGIVLFAAGRTPNTRGLGLEQAGVDLDPRGRIVVDRCFRTSVRGVYAVGDVVAPTLASMASQQGRAAACHALGLVAGVSVDRAPSAAVYGLPEIAGVGATEEQVQADGTPYVVGRCDLAATARGAIAGAGGRLKLIFRADDRKLLGVHCIGEIASELVGLGHAVLHLGGAVDVFLMLAFNTPTYTAAYRDAAIDGLARLSHATFL